MNKNTVRRTRDGVYHARWEQRGEHCVAHVRQAPTIRRKGRDLSEVIDELYWALFKVVGDDLLFLQPVPAYAPRLAVVRPGIRIADWVAISSARGEFHVLNDEDELWEPPSCKGCKWIRSTRTRKRLRARLLVPGSLATPFQIGMATIHIAPETFRKALTPGEQAAFTWRAVTMEKSRHVVEPWWELRPRRFNLQRCGIKGVPAGGSKCRKCGRKFWGYGTFSFEMTKDYLAEADLARTRRSLIIEGDAWRWDILIRHSRWLELQGTPAFKGIVPEFYGLVPRSLATPTPRFIDSDTYHKQFVREWLRSRRNEKR